MEKNKEYLPAPMIPFKSTTTFRGLPEARMKLGHAAHGEDAEDAWKLNKFCNPIEPHKMHIYSVGSICFATIKLGAIQQLGLEAGFQKLPTPGTKVNIKWSSKRTDKVQEARSEIMDQSFYVRDSDLAVLPRAVDMGILSS